MKYWYSQCQNIYDSVRWRQRSVFTASKALSGSSHFIDTRDARKAVESSIRHRGASPEHRVLVFGKGGGPEMTASAFQRDIVDTAARHEP